MEWVNVKERLPEIDIDVLAFNGNEIIQSYRNIAYVCENDFGFRTITDISWKPTYWMPLPKPPEKD